MVLLAYLAVFALIFIFRYRSMSGAGLTPQVDRDGHSYYEKWVHTNKRRTQMRVALGLPTEQRLFFKIRTESFFLRFVKAIGAAEEYRTGEEGTDERLLFISDDPFLFSDIMQQPKVRAAVRLLAEMPHQLRLQAFGHRLWLEVSGVSPDWPDKNRQKILSALWEISEAAGRHAQMSSAASKRRGYAWRAVVFMALHSCLLFGGISGALAYGVSSAQTLDAWRLVYAALALVPLCAGIWIIIMLAALRRSMWLVMALADFILIGLAGLTLSVLLAVQEANRSLPQPPPRVESVPLAKKNCAAHCSSSRGGHRRGGHTKIQTVPLSAAECRPVWRDVAMEKIRTQRNDCDHAISLQYKLYFDPWRKDQTKPYVAIVPSRLFDAGEPGDLYDFTVHTGAFGHAWIDKEDLRRSPNEAH